MQKTLFFFTLLLFTLTASTQSTFSLDQVYDVSPNGTLKLTTEDANVTIKGTSRKDAHVKIYRKIKSKSEIVGSWEIVVNNSGGDLSLTEKDQQYNKGKKWLNYEQLQYTVEIEIPYGMELKIIGEDDDYVIDQINGDIDLTMEDGNANISGCDSKYWNITMEDGDVDIDKMNGEARLRMEDGDIIIKDGDFSSFSAILQDGDIDVESNLNANAEIEIQAEDGDITFTYNDGGGEFDVNFEDGDVSIKSDGYDVVSKKDNRKKIKTSSNGSAEVRISVEDGDVILKKG